MNDTKDTRLICFITCYILGKAKDSFLLCSASALFQQVFEEHHLTLFETQASLLSEEEIAPSRIYLKGGLPSASINAAIFDTFTASGRLPQGTNKSALKEEIDDGVDVFFETHSGKDRIVPFAPPSGISLFFSNWVDTIHNFPRTSFAD